jgi:hypothetical protein
MVKFDYSSLLPQIFKENKLSILPITRGKYVISDFKAHHTLEPSSDSITYSTFPEHIDSINPENIYSESVMLNTSFITDIISDFVEDELMVPTVTGRKGTHDFDFNILRKNNETFNVKVSASQIEVDGAWEGVNFLSLVEAKIDYPEDFLIRQLYYPFRTFEELIDKEIKNIFLFYSNDMFSLYEYSFEDKYCYNSLKLKKQCNYILQEVEILLEDITGVYENINIIHEPKIPFPQADSFERVISLCEHLKNEKLTKSVIAEMYSFDERQSYYYSNAGAYLGLINKIEHDNKLYIVLTSEGRKIFNMHHKEKQLALVRCILQHEIFHKVFKYYSNSGKLPSKQETVDLMKDSNLYNIDSDETFKRRASTVTGWIKWIFKLVKIYV